MRIRVRAPLVKPRAGLVNAARGLTEATGERLASCDADHMNVEKLEELPANLRETLKPLFEGVESLTAKIKCVTGKSTRLPATGASGFPVLSRCGAIRFCFSRDGDCR